MSRCGSCGAEIVWCAVDASGKSIPVDAEPVSGGNIVMTGVERRGQLEVHMVKKTDTVEEGTTRYVSHFATCPDGPAHRDKNKGRTRG